MTTRTRGATDDVDRPPIAWVVPGPLRQVTGGYLYDGRIVDGLRARGWPVGVIDLRSTGWPLDPPAGRRLASALRQQPWGAVVVDELAYPALAASLVRGRLGDSLRGVPLMLLVHHLRCSEPDSWHQRAVALMVEHAVVRAADLVVCTSETTARTVRQLARIGTPIEVVRPGWDTHAIGRPSSIRPQPASTHLRPVSRTRAGESVSEGLPRQTTPSDEGLLRLLLVGHWTSRKGILQALAALARTGPGVTLDLVGEQDRDPAYAAQVRTALRDPVLAGRVRVHGRVPDDTLAHLFTTADALVLASSHEGYGMVLAEALAAGLPIVATRVGAVPEVVRHGFEAELVPAGDVEALAQAIRRLAANPAERERRSRLALERARSLPRWSEGVDAFDGHLRALLARTLTST